ncbi:putative two-component response regulator [Paenibacillus marchantiophytorum]|uniref:Two-component response regulator n=1 Tax=Paenibacillus marchantiophytorum TaxID=1619310 RepID=A0ABQ1EM19_9BACL|nr:helix-turn-helix domain-containing protein [Paenibacillus marchantiophytorum]GFZ77708.1 putative two-component response regulator [Paenibacillus marchantiophytorum]
MSITPISVLIIDDELPLRQELRSMPWPSFGAELVGEAENGEEALELCKVLEPDLVISDITMPIMDGLELFRIAKKQFPLIQFVLLTCHSDFHYAQEALKLGALDYFTKLSFDEADMKTAIEKARAAIRRETDLRDYEQERIRRELSNPQQTGTSDERRIRKEVKLAQKIIVSKLGDPITLTSVADEVGLSSYYLSRLFREETGESFNDYVTRMRMEKAVNLLQNTQLKVYEVAEQVGIPSYRYFSQLFRNWTGVAPTDYKKG